MAQSNFEGDLAGLSGFQLEFINTLLIKSGLKNDQTPKVFFEPLGKAGDNYASSVKRIILVGKNGKQSLILKTAPKDETLREAMNISNNFKNECIMYTEVLPKFTQLEIAAGVPDEERLRYAKCYGSTTEEPNEVILLEDLNASNFIMLDRFQPLSNECVKSVLKNFAKLHSLSYALKKQNPEEFDHFCHTLCDIWVLTGKNPNTKIYFEEMEEDTLSVLDDKYKNIVQNKVRECIQNYTKLSKGETYSRYNVIQQGDAWTNNIMFKTEENEKVESVMIDYQLSRVGNPACDILKMIFNCTDFKTRTKYFCDWIDYYHMELDKHLSIYDLKSSNVYTKDELNADLKRYSTVFIGFCVMTATLLTRNSEDAINFEDIFEQTDEGWSKVTKLSKISSLDDKTVKLFKDRVEGIVVTMIEFGLL